MAAEGGGTVALVADRLFTEGYVFDFFQAVRLLEKMASERQPVGQDGPPAAEAARFRSHLDMTFPASSIYQIEPAINPATLIRGAGRAVREWSPVPTMTVTFMGLTGPSGVLPRHYTEMLMRARDARGPERYVARDWFDLFNHRLISLFYRAWGKYRFWLAHERGEHTEPDPDIFTESLFCLIGLGNRSLRKRLRVEVQESGVRSQEPGGRSPGKVLARVDDLALLYYGGLLAHRPRCAISLERLLEDYFRIPVRVLQFQGQWLQLDPENQSQLGVPGGDLQMGVNAVVGERVWDIRSKIRIRLGPLNYKEFESFLPDQSPVTERKVFFKLMHLVRLYVGLELKVEVQLILKASEIPRCRMLQSKSKAPRLGWNSWLTSRPMRRDSEDAVFAGFEVTWVADAEQSSRPA